MSDIFTIFKKEIESNINTYYYYLCNPSILVYDFFERCMDDGDYIHFIKSVMVARSWVSFFNHEPPSNTFDIDDLENRYDLAKLKIFVELDKHYDILSNAMLTGWYDEALRTLVRYEICNDSLLMLKNFIKLLQQEHEHFGVLTRHRLGIPTRLLYDDESKLDLNYDLINILIDKRYMNIISHTHIIHVIIEIVINEIHNTEYADKILKSINYVKMTDPTSDFTLLKNKIEKLQEFVES